MLTLHPIVHITITSKNTNRIFLSIIVVWPECCIIIVICMAIATVKLSLRQNRIEEHYDGVGLCCILRLLHNRVTCGICSCLASSCFHTIRCVVGRDTGPA